ncbi:MAG: DUF1501 domain-containing protein [Planctomycetaceae bacterium]|nr:DUF1501 domain-containing protein [Planctomycetaceae bacterium]
MSRRSLLEAAGAGLFGLSLPRLLEAEATVKSHPARAKSVIFLMLFGGPSQLETFDLKPSAPSKIRGPFSPTACKTPGLLISECLPRLAGSSDKFCVVRTMGHPYNDHSGGAHYIQTGKQWPIPIGGGFNATPRDWPSIGSVVEYVSQHHPRVFAAVRQEPRPSAAGANLPAYVVAPNFLGRLQEYSIQLRRPGEYAGWLGRGYDPLTTTVDKRDKKDNPYIRPCTDDELNYQIQGLALPAELTLDRVARRQTLSQQLDEQLRSLDAVAQFAALDNFQARAFSLATSPETKQALDIRQEPAELRDKYGRNLFGQSVLLARRLVEAGVRYVTVHFDCPDGYGWDSHIHSDEVKSHLLPALDNALASLLDDLSTRGLLDETLVVCLGEMGRTPQATDRWGRGHWSTLFPAVLAGAGIRGGTVYGTSDKDAAYALDHPTRPEDLAATIYHALGIDHHLQLPDAAGRPVSIVEGGQPLLSLFG